MQKLKSRLIFVTYQLGNRYTINHTSNILIMKKLILLFLAVSSLSSCTINKFNGGTHHHYNYQPIDINPKSERAKIWDRLNDQSLNQKPVKYNTTIKVDANGNTYTDTQIQK